MSSKAFRCIDESNGVCIVAWAANAGKARHMTVQSGQGAGFDVTYADIRVTRAPEYDGARQEGTLLGCDEID